MRFRSFSRLVVAMGLLGCLSACSGRSAQPARVPSQEQRSRLTIDPTTTGSIRGSVSFIGEPPKRPTIDMELDPACKSTPNAATLSESVIISQGKLQNAFVYVKDGLGNYLVPKPSSPVVLDQVGCTYQPHLLGIVTGQILRVLNSDNTGHNIHPVSRKNEQWNDSQEPHGAPIEHSFSAPELLLPIICNKHPWMRMYLNVVENPFFAVSDSHGEFEIAGLPPGSYTLEAVHEKLGTREFRVTVKPRGSSRVELSFGQ